MVFLLYMGVEPKIGGFYPQNGWFINNGKPSEQMDDLGGTIICGNTHIYYGKSVRV